MWRCGSAYAAYAASDATDGDDAATVSLVLARAGAVPLQPPPGAHIVIRPPDDALQWDCDVALLARLLSGLSEHRVTVIGARVPKPPATAPARCLIDALTLVDCDGAVAACFHPRQRLTVHCLTPTLLGAPCAADLRNMARATGVGALCVDVHVHVLDCDAPVVDSAAWVLVDHTSAHPLDVTLHVHDASVLPDARQHALLLNNPFSGTSGAVRSYAVQCDARMRLQPAPTLGLSLSAQPRLASIELNGHALGEDASAVDVFASPALERLSLGANTEAKFTGTLRHATHITSGAASSWTFASAAPHAARPRDIDLPAQASRPCFLTPAAST